MVYSTAQHSLWRMMHEPKHLPADKGILLTKDLEAHGLVTEAILLDDVNGPDKGAADCEVLLCVKELKQDSVCHRSSIS
eukprot:1141032-Pelagomonas_calceolata.AAC.8